MTYLHTIYIFWYMVYIYIYTNVSIKDTYVILSRKLVFIRFWPDHPTALIRTELQAYTGRRWKAGYAILGAFKTISGPPSPQLEETRGHQRSTALQNQCIKSPPHLFSNKLLKPNTKNVLGGSPTSLGLRQDTSLLHACCQFASDRPGTYRNVSCLEWVWKKNRSLWNIGILH